MHLTTDSEEVTIFSHSHGYDPRSKAVPMDLCIEKNVWVGYRAVILESCSKIHQGVIIAACGLVSKNLDRQNFIFYLSKN
jgi:acetyltransferase-like isoleucine patch superfamily enzyme